jgi:hypothetical protein
MRLMSKIPRVTRDGASGPEPSTSTGSRRRGEAVTLEEVSDPGDPERPAGDLFTADVISADLECFSLQ